MNNLKSIFFFFLFLKFFYAFGEEKINTPKLNDKNVSKSKKSENKKAEFNKKGFDWMGIPFLKFRSDFGLGGGAKVSLFDYGDGNHLPFKYNLQLQYFATNMGKKDHVLYFVAPDFKKKRFTFDVELRYQYIDNSKYFGIGNDSIYNNSYENLKSSQYKSSKYYEYKRTKPRFILNVLKGINSKYMALFGLGIQRSTINQNTKDGNLQESYLFEKKPYGVKGGFTNFLKIGLVYDTRNFIASPKSGVWSEFAIELSTKFLGSNYSYQRYTFTDRRYYEIIRNIVLAQQVIYEWMTGNPPFYEYSFIGGSATLSEAMGGEKSLRGYLQNRFIDKAKLISNTELRYKLGAIKYKSEYFEIFPILFWDMGRVYSKPSMFTIKYLRYTYGGGLRVAWNKFFVGRIDLGLSAESYVLNIGFANIF